MKTEIDFCGIKMKNPVTVASGTFGYGRGHSEFIDLNKLGAIITKLASIEDAVKATKAVIEEAATRIVEEE